MRIVRANELHPGDVLGQDVMASEFQVLLGKGTVLTEELIERLISMGITSICLKDIPALPIHITILKKEVEEEFHSRVKTILQKHSFTRDDELREMAEVADSIISEILEEERVAEQVYEMKERSADLYEHAVNLCVLVTIMGLKYKKSPEHIREMGVACLIHDMGFEYVGFDYRNQKMTEMSDYENTEFAKHPVYAYTALKNEHWVSERTKQMVLMHHERLDGSGFPLHSKRVPEEVQIMAICDIFDEMISGIACEKVKVYEAVEYLNSIKGILYNSDYIDTFLQIVVRYPNGTKVRTNRGEIAVVVAQNLDFVNRPVIRIIQDASGAGIKDGPIIEMEQELSLFIDEVLE